MRPLSRLRGAYANALCAACLWPQTECDAHRLAEATPLREGEGRQVESPHPVPRWELEPRPQGHRAIRCRDRCLNAHARGRLPGRRRRVQRARHVCADRRGQGCLGGEPDGPGRSVRVTLEAGIRLYSALAAWAEWVEQNDDSHLGAAD